MGKQTRRCIAWAALACTLAVSPAFASFHFMQIEQVIGGVNGDRSAQAIQLRTRSSFQNQVQQARLIVRDAAGNNPVLLCDINAPVGPTGAGVRILIATPSFAAYCGVTPDFVMTSIPNAYLRAGTLTFESDPPLPITYWRLSWGGASYTGPGTVSTNDGDGNANPPFPTALPSLSTQALNFRFAASALSTNNANDYLVTAGAAIFRNSTGGFATVTLPGGCAVAPGIDAWTTPNNGQTYFDWSSNPIPAGFFGPGSDPFDGVVYFKGEPIAPSSPYAEADVVVRRLETAFLPAPGSSDAVPIEIIALNLVSVEPIVVTLNGGKTPQVWEVRMCLSSAAPQPQGVMNLQADPCACPDGGTFVATLPVLPKFIFTRPLTMQQATLDHAVAARPPVPYQLGPVHWLHTSPGLGHVAVPDLVTIDNDCDGSTDDTDPSAGTGGLAVSCSLPYCEAGNCVDRGPGVLYLAHALAGTQAHHDLIPAVTTPMVDTDADGVRDQADNCPIDANAHQTDGDGDGVGDACDNCLADANPCQEDADADDIGDACETNAVEDPISDRVLLGAVAPNPTAGRLAFSVNLPRGAHVRIVAFDLRGARVATLLDEARPAGLHHLSWNAAGAGLGSGTYYVRLEADGATQSRRFSFIR